MKWQSRRIWHMAPVIAEQGKSFASFLMGSIQVLESSAAVARRRRVSQRLRGNQRCGDRKGATSKNPAAEADGSGNVAPGVANLTAAERQELHMNMEELADMLKEVEERCRQYRHQMQVVVSSFEAIAGYRSSRAYTLLALRMISKHFRCLRDVISGQVLESRRSLGEEDDKCRGSKLRFIDQHFRQQQVLQQLGMMQNNSWRPQRGLPEHSNVAHKATEETAIIKKAKNNSNSLLGSIEAKPEETNNQELLMRFMAGATGHGGGSFGADPIVELSGFAAEQLARRFSGNAISLTLRLQHSENLS